MFSFLHFPCYLDNHPTLAATIYATWGGVRVRCSVDGGYESVLSLKNEMSEWH